MVPAVLISSPVNFSHRKVTWLCTATVGMYTISAWLVLWYSEKLHENIWCAHNGINWLSEKKWVKNGFFDAFDIFRCLSRHEKRTVYYEYALYMVYTDRIFVQSTKNGEEKSTTGSLHEAAGIFSLKMTPSLSPVPPWNECFEHGMCP